MCHGPKVGHCHLYLTFDLSQGKSFLESVSSVQVHVGSSHMGHMYCTSRMEVVSRVPIVGQKENYVLSISPIDSCVVLKSLSEKGKFLLVWEGNMYNCF